MSDALKEFQALLDKHGIRYFKAHELFYRGSSDSYLKLNTDPPASLWNNIIPTVKVADAIRAKVGKPVTISSAYRSPAYNKAVGGETNSYHTKFMALDIQSSVGASALLQAAKDLRNAGLFKGGIGRYPTFIHIDTRGYNANW